MEESTGPLIYSFVFFLSLLVSQIKQIPTLICSNQSGKPRNVACSDFLVLKIFSHVLILVVQFACCVGDRRPDGDHVEGALSVSERLMCKLDK